ncbi:hypothetical protein ACIP8Z_05295 [Streptomyces sp. NPDC088553]|uniref:hypothetical protein n=1 Tax=Streptomyces sp. NPDC088553 TaxID=3365864 RepID=UPI003807493B
MFVPARGSLIGRGVGRLDFALVEFIELMRREQGRGISRVDEGGRVFVFFKSADAVGCQGGQGQGMGAP